MRPLQHLIFGLILTFTFVWSGATLYGQNAVNVTLTADDTSLQPGETTTVRVFGQVAPEIEAESLRILTWYLDLLVEDGSGVITVDWNSLTMAASDSPDGSGNTASDGGVDSEGNCRGIHNTFADNLALNPGPGVGAPVELLSVEVTATAQVGTAMIGVAPGTLVDLDHDFQVPNDVGDSFTGGVYPGQLAITVDAVVLPDPKAIDLSVTAEPGGARVQFTTEVGFNYRVDFSDSLLAGTWAPLPGAPHNSGDVLDVSAIGIPKRFYRVVITVITAVLPDPKAIDLSVAAEPGGARVQFNTEAGFDYRVDYSDTLLPDSWLPVAGAPHNAGNALDVSAVGVPKRFYRVVIEPQ